MLPWQAGDGPHARADPLLWFDAALGTYVPFGAEEFRSIVEGRATSGQRTKR